MTGYSLGESEPVYLVLSLIGIQGGVFAALGGSLRGRQARRGQVEPGPEVPGPLG